MGSFKFETRARRVRRMLGIALGSPAIGPQVVSLEITHNCNLKCSFCESHGRLQEVPITARRAYAGGRLQMDLKTVASLAASLKRVGVDLVELSGKGDPIAHSDLTDVVRTLKGAGLGCSLVTNGTLAKENLAETLIQSGLDRLSVSLNSGSRDVYARVNGRDLWDAAIGFLADVLGRRHGRGDSGARPWVRVSHVLCKENVEDIENMARIPCELKVDEVTWSVMGELPETVQLQLDETDTVAILERIPTWSGRFAEARIVHDLEKLARELPLRARRGPVQENPLQRQLPCYEGWMFCVIGPDGAVVPCCYCEEEVLGNIVEEKFESIWQGKRYRDLRRRMLEIPKTGQWICKECFTNCNRAVFNQRIYNRIHPHRKVQALPPEST